MQVEHHDLAHEFPQYVETMKTLKAGNSHFAQLWAEYDRLTAEIEQLEEADVPVEDLRFEEMKKKRVHLKDDLYNMLVANAAS